MLANLEDAGPIVASDLILSILVDRGLPRSRARAILRMASHDHDESRFEEVVRTHAANAGINIPPERFQDFAVQSMIESQGLADMFDRLRILT
jgi:hypothetical protein